MRAPSVSLVLAVALAPLGLALPARASPWTLPEGEALITFGLDAQVATDEFLIDGTHQSFPLDGQYVAMTLRPGFRWGVTDRTELGAEAQLRYVSYQSDEAYFGPEPAAGVTLPDVRDGILSFDRSTAGLGDIRAWVRYRFTPLGRVVAAVELNLKFPTGYRPLTDALDEDAEARRGAPIDDVTLGDGQLDLGGVLLFGWAPPGGWFLRLDVGLRARFFGPGQQVTGAFKLGWQATSGFIPYIGVDGEHSFTDGEVVGQTYNTDVPDRPARELDATDVYLQDYRQDRTWVRPAIGAIFRLGEREIDLSYSLIVWGRNVAQVHAVSLGLPFAL